MSDLLYGVFGGDMGALNALFALMFPIFLILAFIGWAWDKVKR